MTTEATPVLEYRVRDGHRVKGDRQAIAARLTELRLRNVSEDFPEGQISPSEVYEDAKSSKSPLHANFIWDVKEAALQYNLKRATDLICSYEFVVIRENREPLRFTPAFVPTKGPSGKSVYAPSQTVMSVEERRVVVLAECRRQLAGITQRLAGLQGITPQIVKLLNQAMKLIDGGAKKNTPKKAS